MYEKQHKSNIKKRIIAVILAVAVLAGSAFALTPTITKVSMPDPYGVMPLAINPSNSSYTAVVNGTARVGISSSDYKSFAGSYTVTGSKATTLTSISVTTTTSRYFYMSSGSYIDVTASVDVSSSDYTSVIIAGGGQLYLTPPQLSSVYPDTAQLLVNGSPVGSVFNCSSGSFTATDTEVELSSSVTSIGVRFMWTSAEKKTLSSSSTVYPTNLTLYFADNLSYTAIAKEDVDYIPFFERVIAWEQSIYSAIISGQNAQSEGVGRLTSIFARDDDIQLRDDVDSTLQEVTTQFYDQTSTSSSSMTVETVQNVKGISDGMDAMFSSGYSVSDAFTEIAENDDFMSWFTAETAAALDATGQAAAVVGDDDPYNMHYYYDNLNKALGKRGND